MIKNSLLLVLFLSIAYSCKEIPNRVEGSRLEINDSITLDKEIENFISPYRDNVNKNLFKIELRY